MEEALAHTTGSGLREYLLLIDLAEELREKIEKCRKALLENYRVSQPATGRPTVTLVRFTAKAQLEEKIIGRLQSIIMKEKPFMVELQDFGSYPMHAIFIRIANQPRVLQLIKNLKQARILMKASGEDPHFLLDPQIALAGRLPKEIYLEAMKEYRDKPFSGRFMATACVLLSRKKNEKRYRSLRIFEFDRPGGKTAQGSLFG